jgi:2-methylcitrate dehydratase PrpD
MKNSTEKLAKWVAETSYEDIPSEARKWSKYLILDTLGVAMAGYLTKIGKIVTNLIREFGGTQQSTIVGTGQKVPSALAAFANTKMSNALDMDDCFANKSHFAGDSVFPALALGETVKASGKDLIVATALGYDLAARFCCAMGPDIILKEPLFIDRFPVMGLSYTLFAGVTGATKVLRYNKEKIALAWGVAASAAPMSNTKFDSDSYWLPMVKYNEYGFTGFTAVMSSLLAGEGYTAPTKVFDDPKGFYLKFGIKPGSFDYDVFAGDLGKRKFYITETQIKHYPCCRWINGPCDLFKKIIEENDLQPQEIQSVNVKSHPFLQLPAWSTQDVSSGTSAQFSTPHCMAMIAFRVPPAPEWQSDKWINDQRVKKFRKKVTSEYDHDFKEAYEEYLNDLELKKTYNGFGFRKIPHKVEVKARGKLFVKEGVWTVGDPWDASTITTEKQLVKKFKHIACCVKPSSEDWEKRIDRIIELVLDLENIEDLRELTETFI